MTGRREDGKASSYEKEGGCQGGRKNAIFYAPTFGSRRVNKLRIFWIAERLIESFAFSIVLNRGHLEAGIFSAGFFFPFRGDGFSFLRSRMRRGI